MLFDNKTYFKYDLFHNALVDFQSITHFMKIHTIAQLHIVKNVTESDS